MSDTIDQIQANLAKSGITVSTGLRPISLQAPSELILPVKCPLVNKLSRVAGNGGNAHNWKMITSMAQGGDFGPIEEAKRGEVLSIGVEDMIAKYGYLGAEASTSFEAETEAKNFEDVVGTSSKLGITKTKRNMELTVLGGMQANKLGKVGAVSVTASEATGTLGAHEYSVVCVALTLNGYKNAVVGAAGVKAQFSRTNAGLSTSTVNGGVGIASDAVALTLTTATAVDCLVASVPGAVGYAWFIGQTAGQASKIVAVTTSPKVTIKALPAAGNQSLSAWDSTKDYSANDRSLNGSTVCEFDGLLSYTSKFATNGMYRKDMAGTSLTADGQLGIQQFSDMFASMYENYKVGCDTLYMNGVHAAQVRSLVYGSNTPSSTLFLNGKGEQVQAGNPVPTIFNMYTGQVVRIVIHPDLPTGTIIATSDSVDLEIQNFQNGIWFLREAMPFKGYMWPTTQREYTFGCYWSGLLEIHYGPAFGVIQGLV